MITVKNYVKVQSLQEAFELNQKPKSRILGGMLWLRLGKHTISHAIDLSGLGLDTIEESDSAFCIGCMTSLRQLETHPGLNAYTNGAMKEALRHIVGVQFRNMATIGGSIAGRFGFSDVLTLFLCMDSYVELYKGGMLPLSEFVKNGCGNDILVRIHVKKTPAYFHYQSVRNSHTDFPVLTLGAARLLNPDGEQYQFSIGARPGRAMLLTDTNGLLTGKITPETTEQFASYAASLIPAGSNMRGSSDYRSHLIHVLTARAIDSLGGVCK